jgi:predicted small metal-binding protein
MGRKYVDCRDMPSESNCSLYISGSEDEVVRAAAEHAASVHGHEDTPEMREQLRQFLEPAEAYSNDPRAQEAMPT